MKTAAFLQTLVLFLLTFCQTTNAFCQDGDSSERQRMIALLHKDAGEKSGFRQRPTNTPPPIVTIPATSLYKPGVLRKAIQPLLPVNKQKSQRSGIDHRLNNSCKDTSYSRLLSVYNGHIYLQSVTQTSDGGILVSGLMYDSTIKPNPYSKSYGLLIKLDADGDVIWLKQFEELTSSGFNSFAIDRAFELANGDIICAGMHNLNPSSSVQKTVVFRLNREGNVIWKNTLHSTVGIFNSPPGTFTYWIESATEGLNGDLILCGTSNADISSGKIETVVRLNNLGQLVWDANYGNHGVDGSYLLGAEGMTAFVQDGKIILVGLSHGNTLSQPPAINFLTLDYSNGQVLEKRFFRPDYTDAFLRFDKGFTYWANKCIRLANGHFLFYGKLFSDLTNRVIKKDHFGVVEFDATFNLVKAYSIRSALRTNYYNNQIHFDASGKGLITVFEYIDSYASNVFFGAFQNQQFQHQRKAHYSNVVMPGNNGFAFLPNNGYAYLQTYFLNTPGPNSYIEFRKMHNSDTSSQCLGKDTLLLEFSPLNIMEDSAYSFLDPNEPNKIVASTNTFRQTDTLSSTNQNGCKQINFCDRLKINGTFSLCGTTSSLTFTASKNSACGAIVQWDIDRTAIDSLRVISDSSVTVWFRNSNWQGKLYAMVPAGSCLAPVIDSVVLRITRGQIPVNLGLDKSICPGNTIVLNAGKGYASYRWQDGTTDSTYTVTKPGLYYVTTTDACGGIYKDSVLITATAPIPFDAGPDRAKCNSDTLRLTAPGGFLNYAWSNNYNISSTTTQTVTVNPLVDTAYYVRAEKSPGCFAYDTVRVKVYHSPSINLGADRSFCLGDSAVFNAGAGFQTYAWSNGQVSAGIVAKTAGNYSVMATTAEGCRSLDTVRVQQVYTLPQPGLNKNPALCAGESRTLNPGSFAAYKWSNGSAGPSLTVNAAGTYAVTVTDGNGCKASDTTRIATIHPLPQGFLPADTAICSYGSLELKSLADYSRYTWSNGAVVKAITITLPGIYGLEVMDSRGCRGKDTVVVYTKDCLSGFYMPTAFSPNGDGKNDLLRPLLFGNVKSYRFTVYNRWGEVIYQATELQKGWNGKVAGVLQDNSVFVWTCTYQLEGEGVKHEKGTVTLVR